MPVAILVGMTKRSPISLNAVLTIVGMVLTTSFYACGGQSKPDNKNLNQPVIKSDIALLPQCSLTVEGGYLCENKDGVDLEGYEDAICFVGVGGEATGAPIDCEVTAEGDVILSGKGIEDVPALEDPQPICIKAGEKECLLIGKISQTVKPAPQDTDNQKPEKKNDDTPFGPGCGSDTDCLSDQECSADGYCQPKPKTEPKTETNEKPKTDAKAEAEAQCSDAKPCVSGEECLGGKCQKKTMMDKCAGVTCNAGSKCVEGVCEVVTKPGKAECSADADCKDAGQKCSNQKCVPDASKPVKKETPKTIPLKVDFAKKGADKTEFVENATASFVRVGWDIQGSEKIKEAYLYFSVKKLPKPASKMWKEAEAQETEEKAPTDISGNEINECVDLVISSGGDPLQPGSKDFTKYKDFNAGSRCLSYKGNCHGYEKKTDVLYCRVDIAKNLAETEHHFYFKPQLNETEMVLAAQGENGQWVTAATKLAVPETNISDVSVTLNPNKPVIDLQLQAENATYASVSGTGAECSQFGQDFGATNMGSVSCVLKAKSATLTVLAVGGFSTASAQYVIAMGTPEITKFEGGSLYVDKTGMTKSTSEKDWWKSISYNVPGHLSFVGGIKRKIEVKKKKSDGSFETIKASEVPWVKSVEIKAYQLGVGKGGGGAAQCGTSGIRSLEAGKSLPEGASVIKGTLYVDTRKSSNMVPTKNATGEMTFDESQFLPRRQDCSFYKLLVSDFDDTWVTQGLDLPFFIPPPSLTLTKTAPQSGEDLGWAAKNGPAWKDSECQYNEPADKCDMCNGSSCGTTSCYLDGPCSNIGVLHPRTYVWSWEAQNCKELTVSCENGGEKYMTQKGGVPPAQEPDASGKYPVYKGTINSPQQAQFALKCQATCTPLDATKYQPVTASFGYPLCPVQACVYTQGKTVDWP